MEGKSGGRLRSCLEFSSDLPSDEVADDDEIIRPGGQSVAQAFQAILLGLGCEADPPSEEDHGWAFDFRYRGRPLHCHVGHITHFHAIFEDRHGSDAVHHPAFHEILTRFADALAADQRFARVGWFERDDLLSGVRGASRPDAGLGPPAAIGVAQGAWADLAPHPVRRWAARFFDVYFLAAVCIWAPTVILFGPPRRGDEIAVFVAGAFLFLPLWHIVSLPLNATLLRGASTTLGKWIFGVRIVRKDGGPLTWKVAFRREVEAVMAGCALGIPLLDLFAMGSNWSQLSEDGETSWDSRLGLVAVHRENTLWQGLAGLAAAAGFIALWWYSSSLLP
jgi:uncharacterized RDD family membrane protein YckC